MGIGPLGRRNNLLTAGLLGSVTDVVRHRVVEQNGVLRHDPHHPPKGGNRQVPDILPIDPDCPARDIVEAGQQADKRGLATAGAAHDGHALAALNVQRHPVEDSAFPVGEHHVIEGNTLNLSGKVHGSRLLLDIHGGIQDLEYPVGGGNRLLDLQVHPADFLDRLVHHEQGAGIGHEFVELHSPRPDIHQYHAHPERRDEHNHGLHRGIGPGDLHRAAEERMVLILKPAPFIRLHPKRLDHPHSGNHFLQHGHQISHPLLGFPGKPPDFPPEHGHGNDTDREQHQANQGQPRVNPEQGPHGAKEGQWLFRQILNNHGHGIFSRHGIIRGTGNQLTCPAGHKIGQ